MSRRRLVCSGIGALAVCALGSRSGPGFAKSALETRGVVLTPDDLSLADWPERAARAGLTTIALHPFPGAVITFVESAPGRDFLERCSRLGVGVEYELHAMRELLPREEFARTPEAFRMNERGERSDDANLCVHSSRALEIASAHATRIAAKLKPASSRYFFWGDDGGPWCRCHLCREYPDSDQALLFENHLLETLRRLDPKARLAHLAYAGTMPAPARVKPRPGIFLEFAPIHRTYDKPYSEQAAAGDMDSLRYLDANLRVFPAHSAQVLEYWLDSSRFSNWRRPAVRVPWRREIVAADAEMYARRGIRHITSFAVYIDAEYVRRYGEPAEIQEYGDILRSTG
jgi:hypothetical protein